MDVGWFVLNGVLGQMHPHRVLVVKRLKGLL